MRLRQFLIATVLAFTITGPARAFAQSATEPNQAVKECKGTAEECKKPVKFISKEGNCTCFKCEYGTPNVKLVCTESKEDTKALLVKAKESSASKMGKKERDRDASGHRPPQN